ncbi:response regulator transcription factor [Bacteroidia bacterium]|jgi:two-component system alkaline phosphatase synthesis response regulator PhoP|nr:response regulator transcription factor [Bacteroidia bacterium]
MTAVMTDVKARILLVEDEEHLNDLVKMNLEMDGFKVIPETNGVKAIQRFKEEKFDLVILDVMLPGADGIQVCETIRLVDNQVPIIFVSAKGTPEDRIKGLKKGGDDYLAKPFNLEELILKVNKSVNRQENNTAKQDLEEYAWGDNFVNFSSYKAIGNNGEFTLTKKEALLLKLLIENKDEVVSREKILQSVWGYTVYPSTRTIDNFILAFRKYFEKDSKNPVNFTSLRGVGYKFSDT